MVSDVFREHKRGTFRRKKPSFLNHFIPVLFFCIYLMWTSENLRSLLSFLVGINSEHWEKIGEIISYYMLIFTQFKDNFFQGAAFINCYRIFRWTLQDNPFYVGYPVFIHMRVKINNLQTQKVEITLIQCLLTSRRWNSV